MSLEKNRIRSLNWGSHIPVTLSVIKTFPISGALELGAGLYSTKLLFDLLPHVVSIENNNKWIETLRSEVKEDVHHRIIHHPVLDYITNSTRRERITKTDLEDTKKFYLQFVDKKLNYLFVDCYTGFRLTGLNLYQNFDVVAYHDAQEELVYDYDKFVPNDDYNQYIYKTFKTHTGLLISKKLVDLLPKFIENLKVETKKFATDHNVECELEFTTLDDRETGR